LALVGNTILLLVQLRRNRIKNEALPVKAEKPGRLDQVLQYIEDHLGRKITLEEVARHFFVSESTITQLFRRKMGDSFYHCVTQRRLIAAKTLIAKGISMEDVSEQVGFADYSAFYRAFKKEYGISPAQYRKLVQNFE
jgi:AraC-like DNA-binding protein